MKSDANQGKESSHFNVVMAEKLHFCVNEAPQLTSKMVICQKDALSGNEAPHLHLRHSFLAP